VGQSQQQDDNPAVHWLGMLIVAVLTLGSIQPGCITTTDRNSLITAAYKGDTGTVNKFLSEGFDVN
jgi:hypothetical protein